VSGKHESFLGAFDRESGDWELIEIVDVKRFYGMMIAF